MYVVILCRNCAIVMRKTEVFVVRLTFYLVYWIVSVGQAISNLSKAFESGFDNYSTVRGDPDLDSIKKEPAFIKLMDSYETKGFNPFGLFGKK